MDLRYLFNTGKNVQVGWKEGHFIITSGLQALTNSDIKTLVPPKISNLFKTPLPSPYWACADLHLASRYRRAIMISK